MVMFGAQLDNERVEEWAAGYVDYGHLKKVLSELVRSGKSQARLLVDSEACRASTAHAADGPRLADAGGSLRRAPALEAASGEPAGRSLSHPWFHRRGAGGQRENSIYAAILPTALPLPL